MDPIAELLSQLSGVRRVAGSSSSQLQQLQMELQLQRQQAQAQRQTLDRLARRPPAASSSASPAVQPAPGQPGQPPVSKQPGREERGEAGGQQAGQQAGGFLLAGLRPDDVSGTSQDYCGHHNNQETFLSTLLLGALSLQSDPHNPQS